MRARVFTLAGARPGDMDFKAAYEAESRIETIRFQVRFDIVPYLPFGNDAPPLLRALLDDLPINNYRLSGYHPVGRLIAGGASFGEVVARAFRDLIGVLFRRNRFDALLPTFVEAHLITPQSAYERLVLTDEPGCTHI